MKLTRYIIIIILITLSLDFAIDKAMDWLYQRTFIGQTGGKVNHLLKHFDQMNVLAIGDSRCAHHAIPEKISKNAYNLSHNGMSIAFQAGLIDQLLNYESIEIDTLLLHVELYEFLSADDDIGLDIQHLKYYYTKNPWIRNEISQLSRFESLKFRSFSYKWNGRVTSLISNQFKSIREPATARGFTAIMPNERDSINVTWDYQKKSPHADVEIKQNTNQHFVSYLDHVKELCTQKNVVLICFTSPIYKPNAKNRQQSKRFSTFFAERNIPFLNYYDLYDRDARFQSIHIWRDVNHMNQDGALLLSALIRSDLKTF